MADKSQLGQKKCRLETEADRKRTAVSLGDMNEESAHKAREDDPKTNYIGGDESVECIPSDSVLACMQQIQEKAQEIHMKWLTTLSESESFESMAVVRVDDLLKRALLLKESLMEQKKVLISKVKSVTSILEQPL